MNVLTISGKCLSSTEILNYFARKKYLTLQSFEELNLASSFSRISCLRVPTFLWREIVSVLEDSRIKYRARYKSCGENESIIFVCGQIMARASPKYTCHLYSDAANLAHFQ